MRILLVEDDESVAAILHKVLTNEHYVVDVAGDGQAGWNLASAFHYDLVILDVVLPKLDGLEFCRRLRDHHYSMPVLLVTALDSSTKKIAGLNAGADDYITKPFELEELMARVRAVLRRSQTSVLITLEWGDLRLETNSREVTYQNNSLSLTPKEHALLELFLRHPAQVFSRRAILDSLWSESEAPGEETVTSHMKGLRRKLSCAGASSEFIETVYGVGYRLKPLIESADTAKSGSDTASSAPASQSDELTEEHIVEQKTKVALATLWASVKYQQIKRISLLKQMLPQMKADQLSSEARQRAYRAAHGLTGVLGIFGLTAGSELSREMQSLLQGDRPIASENKARLTALVESLQTMLNKEIQPSEAVSTQPDLPLLVLIDPQLNLPSALIPMLWEKGLTVKILPDLDGLKNLLTRLGKDLNSPQGEGSQGKGSSVQLMNQDELPDQQFQIPDYGHSKSLISRSPQIMVKTETH